VLHQPELAAHQAEEGEPLAVVGSLQLERHRYMGLDGDGRVGVGVEGAGGIAGETGRRWRTGGGADGEESRPAAGEGRRGGGSGREEEAQA
jgi:hypothetical protein